MTPVTADGLRAVGLDPVAVELIIDRALDEDLGPQRLDVTSVATVPAGQVDVGDLVARADGVLAGLPVAAAVFDLASNGTVTFAPKARDGAAVRQGDLLATPGGPTPALLAAQRTPLELLCPMCGAAAPTRGRGGSLEGTGATVLDT